MADTTTFEQFLAAYHFRRASPATEAQIVAAEAEWGRPIPEPLRSCYGVCDGATAGDRRSDMTFHSLPDALHYADAFGSPDRLGAPLVLVDNGDSNPICVFCDGPLAGYVAQIFHDDAPRLMWRSADGFFRVAAAFDGDHLFTESLPSDFVGPERTAGDLAVAVALIADPGEGDGRSDALRFACDLLPDDAVAEIVDLVELGDEDVRYHVMRRLDRIPSDEVRRTLAELRREMDDFADECAAKLRAAGCVVDVSGASGGRMVRVVRPHRVGMHVRMLFSRRREPGFDDWLLEMGRR